MNSEQRQRVIDHLSKSYALDEIDIEELERRMELAEKATTEEELRLLVADLDPGDLLAPRQAPEEQSPAEQALVTSSNKLVPAAETPQRRTMMAIFGNVNRTKDWSVPRQLSVVSVFGGADLDLREARLGPGVTEIKVVSVFGGVNILVPPDLTVEVEGMGVLGSFDHHASTGAQPRTPRASVRISGVAVMGGVEIRERYPGESGRQAHARLKREKKEQQRLAADQQKKLKP